MSYTFQFFCSNLWNVHIFSNIRLLSHAYATCSRGRLKVLWKTVAQLLVTNDTLIWVLKPYVFHHLFCCSLWEIEFDCLIFFYSTIERFFRSAVVFAKGTMLILSLLLVSVMLNSLAAAVLQIQQCCLFRLCFLPSFQLLSTLFWVALSLSPHILALWSSGSGTTSKAFWFLFFCCLFFL